MELMFEHLANGFLTMLIITMPLVLTAASIGLVVGILQAVTSIQEQTIAAAPKILLVFMMIIMLGGFFTNRLKMLMLQSGNLAFNILPKQGEFVLPADVTLGSDGKYYSSSDTVNVDKFMKNAGDVPYAKRQQKMKLERTDSANQSKPNLVETIKIQGNNR